MSSPVQIGVSQASRSRTYCSVNCHGYHVLVPGQVVPVQRLAQADAVLHANVAEVVDGEGDLVADDVANARHVVGQQADAFVRQPDARERMHDVQRVHHARRRRQGSRNGFQQADAHVHLQEGEPPVHAFLQAPAHLFRVRGRRGIAVNAYFVPEFPAGQLVGGHAVGLAREIHQGHLDGAYAAGLPRVVAELADLSEDLVDVAGVLAQDARLEGEGVGLAGAVPHLAQAVDVLVGVEPDYR